MLTLSNIKGSDKSHRDRKRIGRGQGSGQGTQAGKGHKGQKARSGGGAPIGFEGGQTPLYRRLPKRGFSNAPFKKHYASISLKIINVKFDDGVVNKDKLLELGLLSGQKKNLPIKILNCDQFDKKLTFQGIQFFSKSAKEKILALGGSIEA